MVDSGRALCPILLEATHDLVPIGTDSRRVGLLPPCRSADTFLNLSLTSVSVRFLTGSYSVPRYA